MTIRYDVKKEFVMSLLYSATTGDLTAMRRFKGQVSRSISVFNFCNYVCLMFIILFQNVDYVDEVETKYRDERVVVKLDCLKNKLMIQRMKTLLKRVLRYWFLSIKTSWYPK